MKAIFLSDVHLRDGSSIKTRLVIRFLQETASRFENIYILGDLFDVWPGTNAYLVRTFRPVIQTLKKLVEDGHQVHYVEGNHDFRLGQYFTEALGIHVYPGEVVANWDGRRIYMAHGDLGNPKDLSYRALRFVLRRDILHTALKVIPPEWIYRLGARSSGLSRKYQQRLPVRDEAVRSIYRKTAGDLFRRGFDVVIMGHTHIPDDFSQDLGGRKCRYLNTGDWVRHFTYLEYDGQQFYTRTHPVRDL